MLLIENGTGNNITSLESAIILRYLLWRVILVLYVDQGMQTHHITIKFKGKPRTPPPETPKVYA